MEIIAKGNNVDLLKMKKDRLILSHRYVSTLHGLINLLVHLIFQ